MIDNNLIFFEKRVCLFLAICNSLFFILDSVEKGDKGNVDVVDSTAVRSSTGEGGGHIQVEDDSNKEPEGYRL